MITFCNTSQEVLVAQLRGTLPQSDHTGLNTNGLQLCAVELVCTPSKLFVVDVRRDGHLPRVDFQDTSSGGLVRQRELDFAVETAGPKKSRIQNIYAVRRGDDL